MSWWLWLFATTLTGWLAFQLWRAKTLGKINAGVVDFDRATMPFAFWTQVVFNVVGVVFFGGGEIVIAIHSFGAVSN